MKTLASNLHTADKEKRLENIFWSPPRCFELYQDQYGEAVTFDTTYKVNTYNMLFGIFVGVDNHSRTILFGCALIRNETMSTFQWLMKVSSYTFLSFLLTFVDYVVAHGFKLITEGMLSH
jgi:hypothetical protein